MQPEISIIIPVYNIEYYIPRCLNSLSAQTFKNWECIIIDDGSNDNSLEICRQYAKKDSRFIVIHQKNSGVAAARNIGIENARGNYIAFIDGDDTIEADSYEIMFNKAKEYQADIVQGKFKFIGDKKDIRNNHNQIIPEGNYKINSDTIFPWWFGMCWSRLYSKNLIKNNQITFPSEISFCEDTVFSYECLALSKKTYIINKQFYNYYSRNDSALGEMNPKKLNDRVKACEILSDWYTKHKNDTFFNDIYASIVEMKYRTKKWFLFTFKKIDCYSFINTFPEINKYIEKNAPIKIKIIYYLCLHKYYFIVKLIIKLIAILQGKKIQ